LAGLRSVVNEGEVPPVPESANSSKFGFKAKPKDSIKDKEKDATKDKEQGSVLSSCHGIMA
jgi:hypothetical protein